MPGFLGLCWDSLIFIVNCNTYVFDVQYRIIIIYWFLLDGSMQVTMQIHHLLIHVTLHVLEIITVLTFVGCMCYSPSTIRQ